MGRTSKVKFPKNQGILELHKNGYKPAGVDTWKVIDDFAVTCFKKVNTDYVENYIPSPIVKLVNKHYLTLMGVGNISIKSGLYIIDDKVSYVVKQELKAEGKPLVIHMTLFHVTVPVFKATVRIDNEAGTYGIDCKDTMGMSHAGQEECIAMILGTSRLYTALRNKYAIILKTKGSKDSKYYFSNTTEAKVHTCDWRGIQKFLKTPLHKGGSLSVEIKELLGEVSHKIL